MVSNIDCFYIANIISDLRCQIWY